ncbi:MAG: transporter substrate-binding domain-containing protein, partial [Pseudanabaena sp.]
MRQIEKGNKSRSNGRHNLHYLAVIASTLTIATPIVLFGLANHLTAQTITDAIASHSNPVNSEINSLESIRKRGKLIIGVKDNLPPLGFRDRDGNLVGLEIELARELAKELNIPIEFVPLKNRDRLSAIANNQVDLAIAQITVTNNRARLVDFSLPYYTDSSIA